MLAQQKVKLKLSNKRSATVTHTLSITLTLTTRKTKRVREKQKKKHMKPTNNINRLFVHIHGIFIECAEETGRQTETERDKIVRIR